jgi:hypothetical protein
MKLLGKTRGELLNLELAIYFLWQQKPKTKYRVTPSEKEGSRVLKASEQEAQGTGEKQLKIKYLEGLNIQKKNICF